MARMGSRRWAAAIVAAALLAGGAPPAAAQPANAANERQVRELLRQVIEAAPTLVPQMRARLDTPIEVLPPGVPFLVRFAGTSVGLAVNAPVRAQGVQVGTVRGVRVAFAAAAGGMATDVPVEIDLVPERLIVDGVQPASAAELERAMAALVAGGLRARLVAGGLLGGPPHVELAFDAASGPAVLGRDGGLPVLPTAPTPPDRIGAELDLLLARLAALPIERFVGEAEATIVALRDLATGPALRDAVLNLGGASTVVRELALRLEAQATPAIGSLVAAADSARATAERAGRTVAGLDGTLGPKAPLWTDLQVMLRNLDATVRAAGLLVALLERHPDALIRGRSAAAP